MSMLLKPELRKNTSDSLDSLEKNDEDEGGQFFPEDFESKEAMFAAMLEEIEVK